MFRQFQPPWAGRYGPDGGADYDYAGYRPGDLRVYPQDSWDASKTMGDAAVETSQPQVFANNKWGPARVFIGTPNYFLWSFGGGEGQDPLRTVQDFNTQGLMMQDDYYGAVYKQPDVGSEWYMAAQSKNQAGLCLITNYPNCTMQPMRDASAIIGTMDQPEKQVNVMDIYRDAQQRGFESVKDGSIGALRDAVNSQDPSEYDPCDNATPFESLIPLAASLSMLYIYKQFGAPFITDALVSASIGGGLALSAYFIGQAQLRFPNNRPDMQRAATTWVVLGSVAIGRTAAIMSTNLQATNIGVETLQILLIPIVFLMGQPLVPHMTNSLIAGNFLSSMIITGVNAGWKYVSTFLCRFFSGPIDNCQTWDVFPDARRWDVPSIAGLLALEAAEAEGWQPDDPETEFVYNALTVGPGMQGAAVNGLINPTWFAQWRANPFGFIYGPQWSVNYGGEPVGGNKDVLSGDWWTVPDVSGWDGNQSGFQDKANYHLYACQNWDVLRYGTQKKQHPGTAIVAAHFDDWVGNWQTREREDGILVEKALDPNNLVTQRVIPGWHLFMEDQPKDIIVVVGLTLLSSTPKVRSQIASEPVAPNDNVDAQQWLAYNASFYKAIYDGYDTPTKIWNGLNAIWPGIHQQEPEVLSCALYAVSALCPQERHCNDKEITDFWNQELPTAMVQAMLPQGWWPNLPHGNFGITGQPIGLRWPMLGTHPPLHVMYPADPLDPRPLPLITHLEGLDPSSLSLGPDQLAFPTQNLIFPSEGLIPQMRVIYSPDKTTPHPTPCSGFNSTALNQSTLPNRVTWCYAGLDKCPVQTPTTWKELTADQQWLWPNAYFYQVYFHSPPTVPPGGDLALAVFGQMTSIPSVQFEDGADKAEAAWAILTSPLMAQSDQLFQTVWANTQQIGWRQIIGGVEKPPYFIIGGPKVWPWLSSQ